MKFILSPAKTQNFTLDLPRLLSDTKPIFSSELQMLFNTLLHLTPEELIKLYKIKPEKAKELFNNYHQKSVSEQALLAYNGIVFKSMDLKQWQKSDFEQAATTTFICSALYGLLRTTDLIVPYRLDMTHKILPDMKLAKFWQPKWQQCLEAEDYIINLASKEFSSLIQHPQIITIEFADWKDDKYKKINTYVKMARGKFYKELIIQKITTIAEMKKIIVDDYIYNPELSSETEWYFTRG